MGLFDETERSSVMEYVQKSKSRNPPKFHAQLRPRRTPMLKLYAMLFSTAVGAIAGFGFNRLYRYVVLQEMPSTWGGFLAQLGAVGLLIFILWKLAWYYFKRSEQFEQQRYTDSKKLILAKDAETARLLKTNEELRATVRELARALSLKEPPLSDSSRPDPSKDDA